MRLKTVDIRDYHLNDGVPVQPHEIPDRAIQLANHTRRIRSEMAAAKARDKQDIEQNVTASLTKGRSWHDTAALCNVSVGRVRAIATKMGDVK